MVAFTRKSCRLRFSRHQHRPASATSAGKIDTAAYSAHREPYLNEIGITNRLCPTEAPTVLKTTKDPEDQPDGLGLADSDHFAQAVPSSGLQGSFEPHLNRQKSAAEVSIRHSILLPGIKAMRASYQL
jgi:hypothetical protein